jgi:hypothetical protein
MNLDEHSMSGTRWQLVLEALAQYAPPHPGDTDESVDEYMELLARRALLAAADHSQPTDNEVYAAADELVDALAAGIRALVRGTEPPVRPQPPDTWENPG